MTPIKEKEFIEVIKNGLKPTVRTLSVRTLLSDRNLRKVDYKPYYQRNYVWDSDKQSFFIESVLLGTEIPPLIFYKSGTSTEVIDGRQRFETLKKFKENEFALDENGLAELPALKKLFFSELDDDIKEVFLKANIRIFEFSVIGNVSPDIEDKVKKEIFRRYNTGVTPLTMVEVDGAKYDDDVFSNGIENLLKEDADFRDHVGKCLFPTDKTADDADLIKKMVDRLRKLYVLPKFPISKYATGVSRSNISELLYESAMQRLDNEIEEEVKSYKEKLSKVFELYDFYQMKSSLPIKSKFFYETLIWAVLVMEQDHVDYSLPNYYSEIRDFYEKNITIYSEDNSYFYKNIMDRFISISNLFKELFNVDFSIYIRNDSFKKQLKEASQSNQDVKNVVHELESLRTNKPSPISKPVEEILTDVLSSKYLIRPSYQRQEKISISKASSIIESILLGIPLPPLFVYQRADGMKEVVDGQQRLLSIIAFLGKQYKDENGKLCSSKNPYYKLKNLIVLKDLNGKNYSSLLESEQDKILDFVLDEIVIEEKLNENFDPTDLFIRLNQKPYPIKQNSFEMWNSTVEKNVIEKIKNITSTYSKWFYSSENYDINNRTDRMENEELITLLTYIDFVLTKENSYNKVLGMFKRIDRITCRVKRKESITEYLGNLEDSSLERDAFLRQLDETERKIKFFGSLFDDGGSKASVNEFINVKKATKFRRSYQDFYIVWIVLHYSMDVIGDKYVIKENISSVLKLLRNANNETVDDAYYARFEKELARVTNV